MAKCNGVSVSGYWRGYGCGNEAKFTARDGKGYCHTHIGIADKEPERFDRAIAALDKKRQRREAVRDD